jgi:MFS family permease
VGGAVGFGAFAIVASLMPRFWLYALALVPVGVAALTFLNSCNTSIQLSVEPQFRGRVLALYMAVIQGGTPIGAPLIGWIGTEFGARWSVGIGGFIALAAGVWALVAIRRGRLNIKDTPDDAPAGSDEGSATDIADKADDADDTATKRPGSWYRRPTSRSIRRS